MRVVVAAYVVALAAMPFAHHDLVCHLKSSTHCSVCHVGTAADDDSIHPNQAVVDLADAGCAVQAFLSLAVSSALGPSAGRSPPSNPISLL